MLRRETVRNRFRGWHHWTVFPVLLTPADQRRIIIMEKYKLLFTVDIRTTDKGYPLATLHFVHTHAHQSPDIITTKNKNRERILKINTSLSNCVLCTTCLVGCIHQFSDHLLVIEHWFVIFVFRSEIRTSYLTLNLRRKINSILLINVSRTRFTKRRESVSTQSYALITRTYIGLW